MIKDASPIEIKDGSLIECDVRNDNGREIVIKRKNPFEGGMDTKLGDVFHFLPSGLVLKEETGFGATTLELTSKRHSIIVEPIRITASRKAKKHNAQYVGSETKTYEQKIDQSDIVAYISSKEEAFKKIVVVADSLIRVIDAIEKSATNIDFHLMIDEIDSFQLDSSYRESMDKCLDTYKTFPEANRTMISATTLNFSDPLLAAEPKTILKYDDPSKRTINLSYTPKNITSAAVTKIAEVLAKNPNDKVLIAYNSVNGCFDIAKHLSKNGQLTDAEIRIMCSKNSRDRTGEYFFELDSDLLPARLNFITSAYFTGFDLSERYHLISICGNVNRVHSLSEKRLKQIAGRCRHKDGLLSETVIYDTVPEKSHGRDETPTLTSLLEQANIEITALRCIEENYKKNPDLRKTMDDIRTLVAQNTTTYGFKLVRMKGEPVVSYLNIDAVLETFRVRNELYREKEKLPQVLSEAGHKITVKYLNAEAVVEANTNEKASRKEQIKYVVDKLYARPRYISHRTFIDLEKDILTSFQKDIIWKWDNLQPYIDRDRMFELMEQAGEDRDNRQLNNLFQSAFYLTLNPEVHYKRLVRHHIPIGEVFTGEQLLEKWNAIFLEGGFLKKPETPIQAVRLTKLHYLITRKRKAGLDAHFIKKENPYDFVLLEHRPYKEGENITWSPLLYIEAALEEELIKTRNLPT
jgi:hypothetical protein